MASIEEVLAKLGEYRNSGEGYAANCPAHEDTGRHLTVSEAEDGRILVHCHKNCTFREIFEAIGLEPKDAFPKPIRSGEKRQFPVRDHTGRVVAVHHRDDSKGKKGMWWTTPSGKTGLGGLKGDSLPLWGAEAVSSVPSSTPIVLCEGEKAAFALTYRDIPAVGTVTGASGTPATESLAVLKGRRVILWPDKDVPGHKHMQRIGKALTQMGAECRWYDWRDAEESQDAADHPSVLRGNVESLREDLYAAPTFHAPHDPANDGAATFRHAELDYAKLLRARRKSGGITGIRTGIPKIDKGIHGLNKGYSYIIAARPNVGKSLLTGQIALTAAQAGHRVLLQTPEMSAIQYLDRFACFVAGVDYFRVQEGRFSDDEEGTLRIAARSIADLSLVVDEYGSQPIERIRQNIEHHQPDLVVVDYLQYLAADDNRGNRNQQVGQIGRDLARLKSDYNIPVVIAAQLNRASEHRGKDSEPILSDLRDSGELEQDADVVMFIHRPDMNDPDVGPEYEDVKILCRKNRMGQLWHTSLSFVPGQQWLTDSRDAITGKGIAS